MRRASVGKLLKPLQGPLDIHKHLGAVHYPKEGVFVCEADLEVQMLFVRINVENIDRIT